MSSSHLETVAVALVAEGKGILAANETVRDVALLARTRACRRTRNCLSLRWPKRTPRDCPSERNQPTAGHEALDDPFLIRASASRSSTRGLAWAGSGSAGRPAGALPLGQS
jgi:hypothetical protein